MTERDVVCTVLTDSAAMYGSRIRELADQYGPYDAKAAAVDTAEAYGDLEIPRFYERLESLRAAEEP